MGHTKTAVSLPNDLFRRLEERAAEEGAPRSAIVALALTRYFDGIDREDFIRRMNQAVDDMTEEEAEADSRFRLAALRETHLRLLAEETEPWES